jgi:hypothetical protein
MRIYGSREVDFSNPRGGFLDAATWIYESHELDFLTR